MSYDIYIGEAVMGDPCADEHNELDLTVRGVRLDDAPTFPGDEMTGRGNSRHPGYSQWSDFCREAGVYSLFFDKEEGLMRKHPGCFLLRPADLAEVRRALANWRATNQGTTPGFGDRDYLDGEVTRLRRWMEANQSESAERMACVAETLADRVRSRRHYPQRAGSILSWRGCSGWSGG